MRNVLLLSLALLFSGCFVDREEARRQGAFEDLQVIRMAVEDYGIANNGSYPVVAKFPQAFSSIPANRWSGGPGVLLANDGSWVWPKRLVLAEPIAHGLQNLSQPGTVLGRGHLPGDGPDDAFTYGAVLYDYVPSRQIYVLYAVGRAGDQAVIIDARTNASG